MGTRASGRLKASGMLPLLLAAWAIRLFFVFVGPFFVRPDEVFQALEPAHRLVTGYGIVTWEWHAGIRSWFLPGVIAPILQASAAAGLGHSILVVQCVFATLSVGVVATAILFGRSVAGETGGLCCGVLTAFWPDTVLYGAHTLTETQGGNLLAVGTMLASLMLRRPASSRAVLGIGAVLGFASVLRFQLVPGVAIVLVAALLSDRRQGLVLLLGWSLPVAGQALLDTLTLGTPLQSVWKNLAINLGEGRADLFGTMPPMYYLAQMVQLWGAALLPLALCFVTGFGRAIVPGLVVLAVIGSHSLIHHKEFSFIYGALPLILVVAGVGAARLLDRHEQRRATIWTRRRLALVVAAGCVMTLLSGYKPLRRDTVGYATLVRAARAEPDLCGLGFYDAAGVWWGWTGGYSLLDRLVPIYLLRTPADLAEARPGFDTLIVNVELLDYLPADYVKTKCLHMLCLLHRAAPCLPTRFPLMQTEPGLGLPHRT